VGIYFIKRSEGHKKTGDEEGGGANN